MEGANLIGRLISSIPKTAQFSVWSYFISLSLFCIMNAVKLVCVRKWFCYDRIIQWLSYVPRMEEKMNVRRSVIGASSWKMRN